MTDVVLDGFDGPSFVATDLVATKRFWVDYLGGTLLADASSDGRQPCQVLLGGVVLDFYPALPGEAPDPGGPNHQHYAWDIEPDQYDAWASWAIEWGHRSLRVTAHAAIHGLSLFFDDPDGYHMELAAHYVDAGDMEEAKDARGELIQAVTSVSEPLPPVLRKALPGPVGTMSHFTNSVPDLESARRFWIDFMGGELYNPGRAITQFVLAGVLIDVFLPVPTRPDVPPAPGSVRQHYRFRIPPDSIGPWIERAEGWGVRVTPLFQEELLRVLLVIHGAGGYHMALVARFPSVEALRAEVEKCAARLAELDAITEPFTAETGRAVAAVR